MLNSERTDMTTTATTVAGRPLSGWTRDARHGTWHALLPARPGEPVRGALCVDRALLTPDGVLKLIERLLPRPVYVPPQAPPPPPVAPGRTA